MILCNFVYKMVFNVFKFEIALILRYPIGSNTRGKKIQNKNIHGANELFKRKLWKAIKAFPLLNLNF